MKKINLTQGKFTFVDDEDFDWLSQRNWHFIKPGYAARDVTVNGKRKKIMMHRVINNTPEGLKTDHRDGNVLNNQRFNLRNADNSQNQWNRVKAKNCTSKFKGVTWDYKANKWRSQIVINKKIKFLGNWDCEIEAAGKYNSQAKKNFGEFAKLNKI